MNALAVYISSPRSFGIRFLFTGLGISGAILLAIHGYAHV